MCLIAGNWSMCSEEPLLAVSASLSVHLHHPPSASLFQAPNTQLCLIHMPPLSSPVFAGHSKINSEAALNSQVVTQDSETLHIYLFHASVAVTNTNVCAKLNKVFRQNLTLGKTKHRESQLCESLTDQCSEFINES